MNVNKPFSESKLLGITIDVNDIFDFTRNESRIPYVLVSKFVPARHIFPAKLTKNFSKIYFKIFQFFSSFSKYGPKFKSCQNF